LLNSYLNRLTYNPENIKRHYLIFKTKTAKEAVLSFNLKSRRCPAAPAMLRWRWGRGAFPKSITCPPFVKRKALATSYFPH
jgi:hypothetical protein